MRSFESVSDLEIEEYLCGDLAPEAAARIERLAVSEPRLRAHLEARRNEQAAFRVSHPRLLRRPDEKRPSLWMFLGLGTVALAAAGLLLAVDAGPPHVGTRGGVKASLTVRRADRVFPHSESVPLRPGDQVRLTVESPAAGYMTLLGREGAGPWQVYYEGVPVAAGTATAPDSLVLDDHVGNEEWLVVITDAPTSSGELRRRLAAGKALDAATAVLRLVKEAP